MFKINPKNTIEIDGTTTLRCVCVYVSIATFATYSIDFSFGQIYWPCIDVMIGQKNVVMNRQMSNSYLILGLKALYIYEWSVTKKKMDNRLFFEKISRVSRHTAAVHCYHLNIVNNMLFNSIHSN